MHLPANLLILTLFMLFVFLSILFVFNEIEETNQVKVVAFRTKHYCLQCNDNLCNYCLTKLIVTQNWEDFRSYLIEGDSGTIEYLVPIEGGRPFYDEHFAFNPLTGKLLVSNATNVATFWRLDNESI